MYFLRKWLLEWPESVVAHLQRLAPLFARIAAGALGITMIVAIYTALWEDVDSLVTLLGFYETACLALFLWLAIAGPGRISRDHLIRRT